MREFVQRAAHLSGTVAGALRRAIDPPLDDAARPLDIKRAIIEAVEQQVEPAGAGRRILPADAVQVKILVADGERRRALDAVLADLRDGIVTRLAELQCRVPRPFRVDVSYLRRPPAEWSPGQQLALKFVEAGEAAPRADRKPNDVPALPPLIITVLRGQAAKAEFVLGEAVIRIGRSADPTDDRGRPRVNHVAFLENDSDENRTVTRGHALIRFNRFTCEYRLFDEGSANGTRVVRGGEVIDLPKRDPVGLALRSGDEVQLGKAAIRVQIAGDSGQPEDGGRDERRKQRGEKQA